MSQPYADLGDPKGEGTCTSKYLLFRCLERAVPLYVKGLYDTYSLNWVLDRIPQYEKALERKEKIDDYLADVEYRVIGRLDEISSMKKLERYFRMPIGAMVDNLNSISVEEKVMMIINKP